MLYIRDFSFTSTVKRKEVGVVVHIPLFYRAEFLPCQLIALLSGVHLLHELLPNKTLEPLLSLHTNQAELHNSNGVQTAFVNTILLW